MTISVTIADGRTVDVDTNDPQEAATAAHKFQLANQAKPQPNTAVDVARSIPGGLAKGVSAIAGLPGDLQSAVNTGTDYVLEKAGLVKPGAPPPSSTNTPTSGAIESAISEPFGGFYQPQTQAGKYAETVSSFAPSALSPGSLVRRAARVVIPGAASEAAGQVTEGTPLAPYGRTIGALAGGVTTGFGEGIANERAQSARTPSTAQVRAAGTAQYRAIAGTPVTITPQMASAIGGEPGRAAIQEAIRGAEANRETALVQELQSLLGPTLPSHVSVDAADKVGQAFRDMGRGAMRGENPNANLARGAFARRADIETTVQQVPGINEGRALWSQARKSEDIDAAIRAAEERHTTPAGAGDLNQALRREFGKLVGDADFMDGLTHAEQDALRRVANGTFTANLLQRLGKFSPVRNHLTAIAELFGGTTGGLAPEAIGAAVVGEAARQGGRMATVRNARLASELVRSGGTTVRQLGAPTLRGAATAGALGQRPEDTGGYATKIRSLSQAGLGQ